MLNTIRSVRKARGLTLEQVAERCTPPTTAQTIGRLETGTRVLSLIWLNRIAAALDVEPRALVTMPDERGVPLSAVIGTDGAHAPAREETLPAPHPESGMVGVRFTVSIGDYRAGDQLWLRHVERDGFAAALNRDVLIPRPGSRFVFGRLLALDGERMQVLPLTSGARQQIFQLGEWIGVATTLVRPVG